MQREPKPLRGAIYHPGAGYHSYPPPKRRFAAVRRRCGHCGLPADTREASCPVCGARYAPTTRRGRLLALVRRQRTTT
jgi:hypothetical protein